jgi:hypothetical protein
VISTTRPSFRRAFARLNPEVQEAARRAYRLFMQNPSHPSLRFKKLEGFDRAWSVRIGAQYRAVGERIGDKIAWTWIGTHNEFDKLFQ